MLERADILVPRRKESGLWIDAVRRLIRNRFALLGMALIGIFVTAALLAPYVAPYAPNSGSLVDSLQPPSLVHVMGTDIQGRDEYSRILFGARISLLVGFGSVITAVFLGGTVGAIAGAIGGRIDSILMRVIDVLLAIPGILLAIGIVAFLDRGLVQITIAVSVANAPVFARLQRSSLLAVRNADYVVAARSVGTAWHKIFFRHQLRNALTPTIVAATLGLGTAIIDIAGLGFLGLGPPDPRTAEWGTMLQDSTKFLRSAQYLIFFPGLAIMLSVVGFNLLGDGLREAIDPRLKN
jgi:peptide/nickel transport system permease protein